MLDEFVLRRVCILRLVYLQIMIATLPGFAIFRTTLQQQQRYIDKIGKIVEFLFLFRLLIETKKLLIAFRKFTLDTKFCAKKIAFP